MSGIFGVVAFDGAPADEQTAATMAGQMTSWGRAAITTLSHDGAAFGQALTLATPEDVHSRMPTVWSHAGVLFTAQGRIDNRDELIRALGILGQDSSAMADTSIMLAAYQRWGEGTAPRLFGDWSFAAWHPRDRRLVLARDHHGNTALYLHHEPGTGRVLFSSAPASLHAAGVPRRLNEQRFAQGLVSWAGVRAAETMDLDIERLPPAHTALFTAGGRSTHRFWRPEDVTIQRARSLEEYGEGLRAVLDEATRARARSATPVALTLSGGLDSGSVASLASRALRERGAVLHAYTNVPIVDVSGTVGASRFGDERQLASATASFTGISDHHLLDASSVTPMEGIARALAALDQPTHAASNAFWIQDLMAQAVANGQGTLLTGQGGNATISWTGRPRSTTFAGRWRTKGVKGALGYLLPLGVQRRRMAAALAAGRWTNTAIEPAFAGRIGLAEAVGAGLGTGNQPRARASAIELRAAITQPGTSRVGDLWSMNSAHSGIDVRDPTADARVIDYSYSVPDEAYRSRDGLDRMLIRTAMTGLLPDEVRLNPDRGRQSADLVARLRASAGEVDAALAEAAGGPAEEYVSLAKLRGAWSGALESDDPLTTHRAGSILLRGIMASLWINRTYG